MSYGWGRRARGAPGARGAQQGGAQARRGSGASSGGGGGVRRPCAARGQTGSELFSGLPLGHVTSLMGARMRSTSSRARASRLDESASAGSCATPRAWGQGRGAGRGRSGDACCCEWGAAGVLAPAPRPQAAGVGPNHSPFKKPPRTSSVDATLARTTSADAMPTSVVAMSGFRSANFRASAEKSTPSAAQCAAAAAHAALTSGGCRREGGVGGLGRMRRQAASGRCAAAARVRAAFGVDSQSRSRTSLTAAAPPPPLPARPPRLARTAGCQLGGPCGVSSPIDSGDADITPTPLERR
jgi:hypothetical protein